MSETGGSISIRESLPCDEPGLFELWRETFGDEDEYINEFFRRFFRPDRTVAALSEETVVSAMYLLPAGTLYCVIGSLPCCFFYALSFLP